MWKTHHLAESYFLSTVYAFQQYVLQYSKERSLKLNSVHSQ